MDNNGVLHFGVYNGGAQVISSVASYNDGAWHHVAAIMSTNAGLSLYVDGTLISSNSSVTSAVNYTGWWRIGENNTATWPNSPANTYFPGMIDEISIYGGALSANEIAAIFNAGSSGKLNSSSFFNVMVTNPMNNAVFSSGSSINLSANVSDVLGSVTQVQFFQGTNSRGVVSSSPYTLTWSNAAAGSYSLTARATDNNGLMATSAVVSVVVDIPPSVSDFGFESPIAGTGSQILDPSGTAWVYTGNSGVVDNSRG
jgi:hypothetical protein